MLLRTLLELVRKGRHLSEEQSEQALEQILLEGTPDSDVRSFLEALADKGETWLEIAGFARAMRRHCVPVETHCETFIDTAGTGGGSDTFNISTAAAFVIAGAGLPVAKHGNRAVTSRSGSADVLAELGLPVEVSAEAAGNALRDIGVCFLFAPLFHPAMKRVAQIRKEIGRRTIFNLLGPLTNPASAPYQIVGVYSAKLTEPVALALNRLGCRGAWVVHSRDGLDELSISDLTRVSEVSEDGVRSFDFNPLQAKLGIPAGGTAAENARLIRGILDATVRGPARDVVVLNAAAGLHIAGEAKFSRAVARAEHSIDSGAALDKLNRLIEASRGRCEVDTNR